MFYVFAAFFSAFPWILDLSICFALYCLDLFEIYFEATYIWGFLLMKWMIKLKIAIYDHLGNVIATTYAIVHILKPFSCISNIEIIFFL